MIPIVRIMIIGSFLFRAFVCVAASSEVSLRDIAHACTHLRISAGDGPFNAKKITKRYRTLAKECHPDRYAGPKAEGERLFKEINAAHELLLQQIERIPVALDACVKPKKTASCSFDEAWQAGCSTAQPKGSYPCNSPEDSALRGVFTSEFVRNTIYWVNGEQSESEIARRWASRHITPGMRRCSEWLRLMAYSRSNNWQEVDAILQKDPELVNMRDEMADALSLCESTLRDDLPECLRTGHERVREVLLSYGAIAQFSFYDGGPSGQRGAGQRYWY